MKCWAPLAFDILRLVLQPNVDNEETAALAAPSYI